MEPKKTEATPQVTPPQAPVATPTMAIAPPLRPSVPEQVLPRGTAVGRYTVLDKLGAGGMGVVYLAYDPQLQRKVAIKLLHAANGGADASQSTAGHARLLREAQALAQLSHPNVVAVHDVGTHGSAVFMAMEFLEGQPLRAWMKEPPRPWRDVLGIFRAAGQGLAAAHAKGLIHRDFKPENVILTVEGRVCVVDFGLVRAARAPEPSAGPWPVDPRTVVGPSEHAGEEPTGEHSEAGSEGGFSSPLTRAGVVMGTAAYMAPELADGGAADACTDVYAFCVSLSEALYGVRPWTRARQPQAPARARERAVPPWLRRVVQRGIALSWRDRYPTMEAVLEALSKDPTPRRRRMALVAAGVALVAALGGWGRHALTQREQLCVGTERELAGTWDGPSQSQLAALFAKSSMTGSWTHARPLLEAYARGWTTMRREACQATRILGTQSEEVLSLRMACLDRRRSELRGLLELLQTGDAKTLQDAAKAASGLTPVSACADVEALRAPARLPAEASVRGQVAALRQRLARLRALWLSGKYVDGLPEAQAVALSAKPLRYRPLEAEALYTLSTFQARNKQTREAVASAQDAFAAAEAGTDREALADAATELVGLYAVLGPREQVPVWVNFAKGALEALGGDPRREARLALNEGVALMNERREAEATRAFEEVVRLRGQPEVEPLVVAMAYNDLYMTTLSQGSARLSAEYLSKSLDIYDRVLGRDHPGRVPPAVNLANVIAMLEGPSARAESLLKEAIALSGGGRVNPIAAEASRANLAWVYLARGDLRSARPLMEGALKAVLEMDEARTYRPVLLRGVGSVELAAGESSRALATYTRSVEEGQAAGGAEGLDVAAGLVGQADALRRMGRRSEAAALYAKAEGLYRQAKDRSEDFPLLLRGLAELELDQGNHALALHTAEEWCDVERTRVGETSPQLGGCLLELGEAQAGLGQHAAALKSLQSAAERLEQGGYAPELLAQARAAQARSTFALTQDREQVRALVEAARRAWAQSQAPVERDRAELLRWAASVGL